MNLKDELNQIWYETPRYSLSEERKEKIKRILFNKASLGLRGAHISLFIDSDLTSEVSYITQFNTICEYLEDQGLEVERVSKRAWWC